jgi:hypothetical protein
VILGLEFPLTSKEIHAMAAKPSIDPARLLEEQLESASPDLLPSLLSTFIQALMSRHRHFDTRVGTVDVAISKLRSGSSFPGWLLERRRRAEAALTSVVATSYVLGVSTRRMEKLVETLRITRLSESQLSVLVRFPRNRGGIGYEEWRCLSPDAPSGLA